MAIVETTKSHDKLGCIDCVHFKYKERVVVGRIEHKGEDGTVWMIEPKYEELEERCPLHPELFKSWWEKNKHLHRTDEEYQEPDCKDFDLPEFNKNLRKLIVDTQNVLNQIKK